MVGPFDHENIKVTTSSASSRLKSNLGAGEDPGQSETDVSNRGNKHQIRSTTSDPSNDDRKQGLSWQFTLCPGVRDGGVKRGVRTPREGSPDPPLTLRDPRSTALVAEV